MASRPPSVTSKVMLQHTACQAGQARADMVQHLVLTCSLLTQTHEEACRAVREKYGGYICQLPVTLRVLP